MPCGVAGSSLPSPSIATAAAPAWFSNHRAIENDPSVIIFLFWPDLEADF